SGKRDPRPLARRKAPQLPDRTREQRGGQQDRAPDAAVGGDGERRRRSEARKDRTARNGADPERQNGGKPQGSGSLQALLPWQEAPIYPLSLLDSNDRLLLQWPRYHFEAFPGTDREDVGCVPIRRDSEPRAHARAARSVHGCVSVYLYAHSPRNRSRVSWAETDLAHVPKRSQDAPRF